MKRTHCADCVYWEKSELEIPTHPETKLPLVPGRLIGICRRRPPTVRAWSGTYPHDWCGDGRPYSSEEREAAGRILAILRAAKNPAMTGPPNLNEAAKANLRRHAETCGLPASLAEPKEWGGYEALFKAAERVANMTPEPPRQTLNVAAMRITEILAQAKALARAISPECSVEEVLGPRERSQLRQLAHRCGFARAASLPNGSGSYDDLLELANIANHDDPYNHIEPSEAAGEIVMILEIASNHRRAAEGPRLSVASALTPAQQDRLAVLCGRARLPESLLEPDAEGNLGELYRHASKVVEQR